MNPEEFAQLRELLLDVLSLPAAERQEFLDRRCAGRPALREQADHLLRFDDAEPDPPERLGRYEVLSRLGQGGMGVVYLARDPELGREIAIKILPDALADSPVALERFRQEARLLARLNHPNIATIHSFETDRNRLLLTMEHIRGETLSARLESGPAPLETILPILRQIACALEAAHGSGVVHRDLKPANVIITTDGVAKVVDFGIAKLLDLSSDGGGRPPEPDAPMGTPGYMSPEQIIGARVDARTDLWSFGCILHESLAAGPVFGEDGAARLQQGLQTTYDPSRLPAEIPEALRALLPRLLAWSPDARPESMTEVRSALDAVIEAGEFERIRSRFTRSRGDHPPTHLPLYPNRFFGREDELRTLGDRLHKERLISLIGPGGCGKTRLAIEAARAVAARFPDGVWFVDLASVRDPAVVPQKLAAVLGLSDLAGRSLGRLVEMLAPQQALLVLDNCERLVAACGELVWGLLRDCADLRILATSREPLAVAGEGVLRLAPLPLPGPEGPPPADEPAVALFLDRARAASPGFEPTARELLAIREICRRVDGLPLAIELSATWAGVLGPEEIRQRLDRRIDLLRAADPAAGTQAPSTRHLGLRAMIDGSYESLSPLEQRLLRSLSIFRDGCNLEALEAVGLTSERSGWQLLDLVRSLLSKSLLERQGAAGPARGSRYRMLDTLREYAEEKLQAAGEAAELQRRHFTHYQELFSKRILSGPEQADWIARFREEEENLRVALERLPSLDLPVADAARFVGKLGAFWIRLGRWEEGRRRLHAQIDALGVAGPEHDPLRIRLMITCAEIARSQGDFDAAQALAASALALAEATPGRPELLGTCSNELGNIAKFRADHPEAARHYARALESTREEVDPWNYAGILLNRGVVFAHLDRREEAEADFRESLRVKRAIGDQRGIAHAVNALGLMRLEAGDVAEARTWLEESLALKREIEDRPGIVTTLLNLGRLSTLSSPDAAAGSGDPSEARRRFEEALALASQIGDRPNEARLRRELGLVALREGRSAEARTSLHEAVRLYRAWGRVSLREPLELAAGVEQAAGRAREAVMLLAAADRIRRQEGHTQPPWDRPRIERLTTELRRELDPERFAEAWEAGAGIADVDALLPPDPA